MSQSIVILFVMQLIYALGFSIQPHAIKFERVPLSQTVLAGADVSFTCSAIIVDEQTLPQFIWYHNDTEIVNATISNIGINTSTLFISNASEMDQGEYHCIIKDWETRTKSKSGKLIGMYIYFYSNTYYFYPTVTVYADISESKLWPLNVTFNETVILRCNPDGIKPQSIQWSRDKNHSINFSVSIMHAYCMYIYNIYFLPISQL